MDVLRREGQADLFAFFHIVSRVDLEFPSCRRESDLIYTFADMLIIEVIIYADVYRLILIAELPALSIGPCLEIRIKRDRLRDPYFSFLPPG
mgnify:CR=1 FL=1